MLENRPIVAITIGYIIGIIMGLYCKISIVFLYLIFILFYNLFKKPHVNKFKLISIRRYFRYIKLIFTKNVFIIILISSVISNSITIYQNSIIEDFQNKNNGKEVHLKAKVISNSTIKKYNQIYIVKVKNKNFYLRVNKKENLDYGDCIIIKGSFNSPKGKTNYRGFDYKNFLKTKMIYGTVNSNNIIVLSKNKNIFNEIFLKIKKLIQSNFEPKISNVVLGIFLGYTNEISEEIKENFNDSNISHILAVSGMHIGYLILFFSFIFNIFLEKKYSNILIIFFLTVYLNIVGFSPSVVRATIMMILLLCAKLFHRRNDIWTSLSFSLLIILVYNPFSIMNVGLLFSYSATIGIILFLRISHTEKKIINTIGITISASIFLLPITAVFFNKIPILILFISCISGFFAGIIFILTLILVFFGKITLIIKMVGFFTKSLLLLTNIGSNMPLNKIFVVMPNVFEVILYYSVLFISIFIFSIYKHRRKYNKVFNKRIKNLINLLKYRYIQKKKQVKSIVVIVLIFFVTVNLIPKNLKIHFIDVGQGDSCLIITPHNKKILIDGGGSENYDVGNNTLVPYLLARRIKKIDFIIISHFDTDHVGGLLTVMENLKVENVVISRQGEISENYNKFEQIIKEKHIKVIAVGQVDTLDIEKNLYFDILWPNNDNLISDNVLNNNSIVCKMYYKDFSFFFTGDIEEIAEEQILQEYRNNLQILKSDILKVAHHGSKTSSTEEFIDAVKPKIALIGVGEKNTFGHPNDEVIKRLEKLAVKIYRTDQMGEIKIMVNNKEKIKVERFIK